jgi:hypothetical protein
MAQLQAINRREGYQVRRIISLCFLFAPALIHMCGSTILAQREPPKYEVGVQFSSVSFSENEPVPGPGPGIADFQSKTLPGIGGRFTYNFNSHVGFEAEGNLFLGDTNLYAPLGSGGRPSQVVFGIKAGKRFEKFGLFAKTRPGFVSFSEGKFPLAAFLQPNPPLFNPPGERVTHLAFDIGGVFEFYPSKKIVSRFDAGDTIIRYGEQTVIGGGVLLPGITPPTVIIPGETRHNFQFSAGVGFRF